MTAEVLDYRINQIANITDSCIYDDKSLDEALYKLIKMLKEKNNTGWISCSEQLPEECKTVDVTVKEDNDNGGYDLYVFESWYQEGQWAIGKNRYNPTVIAWKPKALPYQPEGECEDATI